MKAHILQIKKGGKKLVSGVKNFDLKNMSSHLSFHKKIIGKALKLIRIRLLEHWQNSLAFCFDKPQKFVFLNEISNFSNKKFFEKI